MDGMQVMIELPEKVAELLARDSRDLSRAVLETLLVTAIFEGRVSQAEARRMLGISRYEMDGLLKRHGAGFDITVDGLEQDTASALAETSQPEISNEDLTPKEPTKSARGLLAKYGPAPSAEEIDRNRAEMFANFARDDV